MSAERPPQLDPALVNEFVSVAHSDLDTVKRLLAQEPALVTAAWDWGGGDFETGLGAAAHMGHREIALFLLENGASLDLFAAAMLGYVEIVSDMLEQHPELRNAKGAHGIPLVVHAQQGGEQARGVVELLEAS
jgi:hypothetical protein